MTKMTTMATSRFWDKEQTKLELKQPEPKPKTSSWIRFRFSRKPKLDILLRPRLCRNGLLSRNFGRNRNIGYSFGRNRLFCWILCDFWFHLIPINPYWPLAILEGFRLPQTLPPQTPAFSIWQKRYLLKQNRLIYPWNLKKVKLYLRERKIWEKFNFAFRIFTLCQCPPGIHGKKFHPSVDRLC